MVGRATAEARAGFPLRYRLAFLSASVSCPGYVGCMWSIAGIHDQGWAEREIFGKIRYMSSEQTKKKVQLKNYLQMFGPQQQGTLL